MIGRWQRHYTISCVAELAQMRKAVTETLAHGVVRTVLETLVGPEFVYLGRHLAARLRSPPKRGHVLIVYPYGRRESGSASRLYCGLVLERGTMRASLSRVTSTLCRRPINSPSGPSAMADGIERLRHLRRFLQQGLASHNDS